ncbi:MAG: hypothetical protein IIA59_12115 [Candidatus Marinimicrobia bacterium]|nr:hypothetical protein [Candidatus Neomarinimicrobiota bacterium]
MPITFRDQEMSTNWSKYASPEATRPGPSFPNEPSRYGVLSLGVRGVRLIPGQSVVHTPVNIIGEENQAHTDVIGEKDEQTRFMLLELSSMVIQPGE